MNRPYDKILKSIVGTGVLDGPKNKQIYEYYKSTGRGAPWCSRKRTLIVCKDGRFVNRPYGETYNFAVGDGASTSRKNKRTPQNNQSSCHLLLKLFKRNKRTSMSVRLCYCFFVFLFFVKIGFGMLCSACLPSLACGRPRPCKHGGRR